MKKSYLLSEMIVLVVIASMAVASEQPTVKEVQKRKLAIQKELVRPPVYKIIDSLVEKHDWPAIFKMLDELQGAINVNEYFTPGGAPLIFVAATDKNFLAAKTLLEVYKANPNISHSQSKNTALMFASMVGGTGDIPMIKLLLHYGANPAQLNTYGQCSIDWAPTLEVRELLIQKL